MKRLKVILHRHEGSLRVLVGGESLARPIKYLIQGMDGGEYRMGIHARLIT